MDGGRTMRDLTLPRRAARGAAAAAALAAALATAGCAGVNSAESAALGLDDRYENVNRVTHGLNKGVDTAVVRPVAIAYDAVTPSLVQFLLRNLLAHLEGPRDFAAHLFAGDIEPAGRTLLRFGLNSTIGAAGLLDPATDFELPKESADFDKTFASWGAGEGLYYEIPLLGPSTLRHTAGRMVDTVFSPTTYLGEPLIGAGRTVAEVVDFRAANASVIDDLFYESADSYASVRSAYIQSRRAFVNDGEADIDAAPDIQVQPQ